MLCQDLLANQSAEINRPVDYGYDYANDSDNESVDNFLLPLMPNIVFSLFPTLLCLKAFFNPEINH